MRKYKELRDQMSPESRARVDALIEQHKNPVWLASGFTAVARTRRITRWERAQIWLADRAQQFAAWLYRRTS